MENSNISTKNILKIVGILFIAVSAVLAAVVAYFIIMLVQAQSTLSEVEQGHDATQSENVSSATSAYEVESSGNNKEFISTKYLVVKGWGIKVKTEYVDKITITHYDSTGIFDEKDIFQGVSFEYQEFERGLCGSALGGLERHLPPHSFHSSRETKQIGSYYYAFVGPQYAGDCSEEEVRKKVEIMSQLRNIDNWITAL